MSETLSQDQIDEMLRSIDLSTLDPRVTALDDKVTAHEEMRNTFLDSPKFYCPRCKVPTKRARFTNRSRSQTMEIISREGYIIHRFHLPSFGIICLKCGNKYNKS